MSALSPLTGRLVRKGIGPVLAPSLATSKFIHSRHVHVGMFTSADVLLLARSAKLSEQHIIERVGMHKSSEVIIVV